MQINFQISISKFSTSSNNNKDKIYENVEDALGDIKDGSTLLVGGELKNFKK